MSSSAAELFTTLPLADAERLDEVCDAFEEAWQTADDQTPLLGDYLASLSPDLQSAALFELLPIELAYLRRRGVAIAADEYRRRYPAAEPYLPQWLAEQAEPAARMLTPGDRFGKYTIIAWLGAGGMGDVYRAVDPSLGREVAIKILLRRFQWSAEAVARIQVEARALAALNHPNIVTVHEFAAHDGVAFMALELLEGTTLAERLRAGPLAPREALDIALPLAKALTVAHDKQIVHRDLKPQNIFLTTDGEAKILDFGLARLAQSPPSSAGDAAPTASGHDTAAGSRLGTTGYMSPEQIRGETVDARSDVFAFGCVLYEMLFAAAPFRRATAELTDAAILNEPLARPLAARNGLSQALFAVCERCLQKSPAARFASAAELSQELSRIDAEHVQQPGRVFRRMEHAGLAVACLLLLALGGWWWQRNAEQSRLQQRLSGLAREVDTLSLDELDRVKVVVRELNRVGDELGMKPAAVDLLVRGSINSPHHYHCVLGYLNLERGTKADIDKAIEQFENSRRAHAEFAPAAVGLGECHYALSNAYASPRREMELVRQFARQALAQGDKSGTAEVLLGIYEHRYRWDWNEAERHFQNALRDHPRSTTALHLYGNALVLRKRFGEGISTLEEALRQDPESLQTRTDLALAYLYSGDTSGARQQLNDLLAKEPQFFPARWALGETFLKDRKYRQAIGQLKLAIGLDPDSPEAQAELAFCLGKDGNIAGAQKIVDQLVSQSGKAHVPPTALAVAHLGANQPQEALKKLELGSLEHDEWLVWLEVDPVFDELRELPEFEKIRTAVSASRPSASP